VSNFGDYLRSLREDRSLYLRDVEARSHGAIKVGWLTSVELGRIAKPAPDRLAALAEVYGLPTADLLIRAGYLRPGETLPEQPEPEPYTEDQSVSLWTVDDFSPGLRDFLESDEARVMRVSWTEVRNLLNTRFYGGPKGKTSEQWQRILMDQRNWDNRSPFGAENPDDELVWKAGERPKG
jgi:transcriptional regulator with XRE-family HTH domain